MLREKYSVEKFSFKKNKTNKLWYIVQESEKTQWERAEKPLEKLVKFPRTTRKTTWNAQRDGSQHNIARAQHIAPLPGFDALQF